MFLWNAFWLLTAGRPDSTSKRQRRSRARTRALTLEVLEDRLCPSGGYLLVDSFNTNSVLRYNEATGAFVDQFVPKNTGGLYSSANMDFGPDHNLYVSNGLFSPNNRANDVLRFDGTNGTFLGDFADSGQLTDPRGVIFGSDGNLYVADGDGTGQVLRYGGQKGDFLGVFVQPGDGGLSHPSSMLFGPDGDLYVMSTDTSEIQRYQGPSGNSPGTYIDTFVTAGSGGGLHQPLSMAFGPDGNLYVANSFANDPISGGILRYQGPFGGQPGAYIDTFIAPGTGGLIKPLNLIFGPGGDLFVGSADATGGSLAKPRTSAVLRYDATGEFLGTFVTPDSGGLRYPTQLLFTESDPVTLAYSPQAKLTTASTSDPVPQSVSAKQVQPLLVETQVQWQATGADTPAVGNLPNPATIVGSNTGDLTTGPTLDPDRNAVGWGWFVNPTPRDDSEITTPGDQGEQGRMDLLTVFMRPID
jgi:sugar lactone lactonase YvrE